jgi:hypothetical protein
VIWLNRHLRPRQATLSRGFGEIMVDFDTVPYSLQQFFFEPLA